MVVRRDKTRKEGEETKILFLKDEDEDEGDNEDGVGVPVHRLWGCLRY